MTTGLWLGLIALVTALCAYLVRPLPAAPGWYVVALVPLTAASIAQARTLARLAPEYIKRIPVYLSSITTLWILAAAAIGVSVLGGFTAGMIGLRRLPLDLTVAWIVFGLAAALLVVVIMKLLNAADSPLLKQLLPVTGKERILFAGLSLTAGITEEIVFRGFLITALGFLMGNIWVAALAAAALFAAMHAYQSWPGAAAAGVLGLALSVPFIVSGSIIPLMVAHAGIDLIAGLWLIRRMQ